MFPQTLSCECNALIVNCGVSGVRDGAAPGRGHGVAQVRAGDAGAVRGPHLHHARGESSLADTGHVTRWRAVIGAGPPAHELQAEQVGARGPGQCGGLQVGGECECAHNFF